MQSANPVTIGAFRKNVRPSYVYGLARFLSRRIFPGFLVGELLLWLLFHTSWPLMLAVIYNLSGKFNETNFMTFSRFATIQAFSVSVKALFLLPLWWLYFVKWKNLLPTKTLGLHIITAPIYVALCISFVYVTLMHILHVPYPRNSRFADSYSLMITYITNLALFYAYNFWLRTKEQQKKEQAVKELAYQSEIQALRSQIEPHFLFNILNSISASVPPSLEKTRVLIAQLADTFRYAFRVNENELVTLADELDFTKTWLALEQQRFGERLQVEYIIDERALTATVPPMLLQPLVESALRHGFAQNPGGGKVTIECVLREGNAVYVAISDTGASFNGDSEQLFNCGVGLKNTARRLKLFYNEKLNVNRQVEGLLFSFYLPIQPPYETKRINN